MAAAIVLVATPVALSRGSVVDPLRRPAFLARGWWLAPFEIRGANRLARIDADLLDVVALPDGRHVTAAGRVGTVISSDDGGLTFQPEPIRRAPRTVSNQDPRAQATSKATPNDTSKATPNDASNDVPTGPRQEGATTRQQDIRKQDSNAGPIRTVRPRSSGAGDSRVVPGLRGPRQYQNDGPAQPANPPAGPANPPAGPANAPKPERRVPKSELRLLEWLVPSAHAAKPASEPPPPTPTPTVQDPPQQNRDPATEAPSGEDQELRQEVQEDLREDLVALEGAHPEAEMFAWSITGDVFRRSGAAKPWAFDHRGLNGADYLIPPATRVISASENETISAVLLSNGDIIVRAASKDSKPALKAARCLHVVPKSGRIHAVAGDRVYRLVGGGWRPLGVPAPMPLRGLFFLDDQRGWVVGGNQVLSTSDGGRQWSTSATTAPVLLNAVFFSNDGRTGWTVGNDGFVATTDDGGASFISRTCPRTMGAAVGAPLTFPPPWYALSWVLALGLFFVGRSISPTKEGKTELAVEPTFASDKPLERGEPDVLDLSKLAAGLSRFLRNEATKPPLTVAITGPWGTGKSSLMNLLRADLRSFGFSPVWFNAWHHQKEEQLLASLLQAIRNQAIPRAWRLEGLLFRIHLLLIRARKHAFKILMFLFVVGFLLASETGAEHGHDFGEGWKALRAWLAFLYDPSNPEPNASTLSGLHLAGLTATVTLVLGLMRGLRAFGLNPGALLATAAGSIKLRDLDAQSSFREKFRSEYDEVARALGVRTLIIFIDDLDRCQPNQVLDVLESVNYLVTSGDCFIVMGMDRTRVEPCVALGFKEISAEVSGSEDRVHRQEYAIQYLDKLINIEVAIPRFGAKDAQKLLAPAVAAGAKHAHTPAASVGNEAWTRLRRSGSELKGILQPSFRMWPLALAVLTVFLGFQIERHFWAESAAEGVPSNVAPRPAGNAVQTTPATDTKPTDVSKPAVTGSDAPASLKPFTEVSDVTLAINAEIASRPPQMGRFAGPTAGHFPAATLFWSLVLAWGVFILIQIAGLRPELVVKDSDEFVDAWKTWYPIIFHRAQTPRALKRFQNRVRFLSMRQRDDDDGRGWGRRLLARFLGPHSAERAGSPPAPSAPAPPQGETKPMPPSIPDPILVVLSAIYQSRGNLFEDIEDVGQLQRLPDLQQIVAEVAKDNPAATQIESWQWNAHNLAQHIVDYRDLFLERVSGVRVH